MGNVTLGAVGAKEQPREYTCDPRKGWTSVRRWRGQQDAIQSLAAECTAVGFSVRVTEGPVWELQASVGAELTADGNPKPTADETPIDTWELDANLIEKDLLQADIPAVNDLVYGDMWLLRRIMEGREEYHAGQAPPFEQPAMGNPMGLFNLWVAGVRSVPVYAPILRLNKTFSSVYVLESCLANVGRVLSTDYLISIESNISDAIQNQMPASKTVERAGQDATLQYFAGWLKTHPKIALVAYGKAQAYLEYHWGLWSTVLYETVELSP